MLIFVILLTIIQSVAYAGWVITEESVDSFKNKSIQTTFIQNNQIRYETPSSIAIIDLNDNIITIVFSQYRAFWSGTANELKQSSISIYDKQLEKLLADVPVSARQKFDSIYEGIKKQIADSAYSFKKNISVVKMNDSLQICGYNAVKYSVYEDSILRESIWHTIDVVPYTGINVKNMESNMRQLNQTSAKSSLAQTKEYINFLKTGIILKSVEFLSDSNNFDITVTNIRKINIVDDFFAPPVGYRKVALKDVPYMKTEQELEDIDGY